MILSHATPGCVWRQFGEWELLALSCGQVRSIPTAENSPVQTVNRAAAEDTIEVRAPTLSYLS